jgi:hypothetical protein
MLMRQIAASLAAAPLCAVSALAAEAPIDISSRLELLVDDALIESLSGAARLDLHRPVPREVVFTTDAPWEGNASGYQSVFQDGNLYRMYYRGGHYKHGGKPAEVREPHPWVLCYAESDDGITWRRPELGQVEWQGSKANNIVLDPAMMAAFGGCPAHTAVFKDANPACPPDQRYKIIAFGDKPNGLYALGSADGVSFRVLSEKAIQTVGAFDSQNLVFWDTLRGEYRLYHRGFNGEVRDVLTAVSQDILNFPKPQWLQYPDSPTMALYTNQIQPYYRAPHLFMGFPMRYCDRGWSEPLLDLPGVEERAARATSHPRYGTTVTDAVFMSSRDGLSFRRWSEAFLRPGPKQSGSWVYGDNFVFWGMVETVSGFGDAPREISLYGTENYWEGGATSFRRYTLRVDGFVSGTAPYAGGEVLTRMLRFQGGSLALNLETSAFGSVQVEVQGADGTPLPGHTLDECPPIFCDRLRQIVRWQACGSDLRALSGRPIRLRFRLRDADLYAFQFVPFEPEPVRPDMARTGYIPPKDPARTPFTVLEDDFSSVPAGTSPTLENLNPGKGDGDDGWAVSEGSPDRVQVLNDEPPGSGKPGQVPYLKVERRDETMAQGGRAWIKLRPRDVGDTSCSVVTVEARILVPSTIGLCSDIDAYDNRVGDHDRRAFHVRFFPDGKVKYWRETHVEIPGIRFKPDAWTNVRIRADFKTATFDLSVDGATATGLPFASADVHRLQCLEIGPNTNRCVLYVQRVKVTVSP